MMPRQSTAAAYRRPSCAKPQTRLFTPTPRASFVFGNLGAERVFGFAEAEALGQSLDIIIPEGLRARHWAGYSATMQSGSTRYGTGEILAVPALRKDGRRISIEFTILPFRDDAGRMEGIAAILRDVTVRFEETRALRRQLAERSMPPRAPAAG
jgi:PAS domain S-box-containing protein